MRVIRYRSGHIENDAEHSYQLAMVCWSANHQYDLKLQDEKLLKYALIHDLVEVYAGDTDAHGDKEMLKTKKSREEKALKLLMKKYSAYPEMLSILEEYTQKKNTEAYLVYMLDKFIPSVNIYNAKDGYFHNQRVDIVTWKKWLGSKIDQATLPTELLPLFHDSVRVVETIYADSFYKEMQ